MAPADRDHCSNRLVQLECLKAGSIGYIVDSQPVRTKAWPAVIRDVILFGFCRGSYGDAVIVEPTSRALLRQARVERMGSAMTVIEVMRICERLGNIKAPHETERMPQPSGAEEPLAMRTRCQP